MQKINFSINCRQIVECDDALFLQEGLSDIFLCLENAV